MRDLVMVVVVVVLGLASGCDKTFSILEVRADANVTGDVTGDADPSCWNPSLTTNEDGDDQNDGCDLCPADPTTVLTDADGDSMDDLCDRHPTLQDTVVDFEGFADNGNWQFVAGTWIASGGAMTVAGTGGAFTAEATLATPVADHPVLDVLFNSTAGVGAYMNVGALDTQVRCEHQLYTGSPDLLVLTVASVTGQMDFDVGGGAGRLRLGLDAAGHAFCHIDRANSFADIASSADLGGATTQQIGILSRSNASTYSSVTLSGQR